MVSSMKSSVMVVTLLLTGVVLYMANRSPLNVRNNNPLNIRYNPANNWLGQIGEGSGFARFESVEYGFRAAYKLLLTYRNNYGLETIAEIIERWAPPNENDTQGYIDFVANRLGRSRYVPLDVSEYPALINAMADKEGKNNWTLEDAKAGVLLA